MILSDVIKMKLDIVFCGMAAGTQSFERQAYFAGDGNKFWRTLNDIGLMDRVLEPHKFVEVLKSGIGLTDLIKSQHGQDRAVKASDNDRVVLQSKIEKYQPEILAFNGKKAAQLYFNKKVINYGEQPEKIGKTRIFVLPSTSGLAARFWDIAYWKDVANQVKSIKK